MSADTPVPVFLACSSEIAAEKLTSAVERAREPWDVVVETTPEKVFDDVSARLDEYDSGLVFLTADAPEQLDVASQLKAIGPGKRVFAVALVDAEDEDLQEQVYASGLNACIPYEGFDDAADRVLQAARFALDVAKI